jgi:hypothetical protein
MLPESQLAEVYTSLTSVALLLLMTEQERCLLH